MADADRNPISGLDPVYFPTGAVLERPVTDRPTHDTIDAIIDWPPRPWALHFFGPAPPPF